MNNELTKALASGKRTKKSVAKKDERTLDLFKPASKPVPKRDIPDECARNPENCTPGLFTGETKRKDAAPISLEKKNRLDHERVKREAKDSPATRQFRKKYNELASDKEDGLSIQSLAIKAREMRTWAGDENIAGRITDAEHDHFIGMINDFVPPDLSGKRTAKATRNPQRSA